MPAYTLDVTPDEYHKLPGFSSTLAKIMTAQSELHARDAHERKAEEAADEQLSDEQQALRDRGNVLHALVLGKGKRISVQDVDKYTTKKARKDRDAARASGAIPVKARMMEEYERTAMAIKNRIIEAGHELTGGVAEMSIAWDEESPHGPVQCRSMLDYVRAWGVAGPWVGGVGGIDDGPPEAIIYDLKIVGDAEPSINERVAERLHYAIQAAAYTRALAALYPQLAGRIEFRFLFVEAKRPWAIWDPKPDGVFRELGRRRWLAAVHAWAAGQATGKWPGYRGRRPEISVPTWRLREEGIPVDG